MTFEEWYKDCGYKYDPEAHEWIAQAAWEAATKAEREACAKVCERQAGEEHNADHNSACADCAAEIRARPNKG